MDKSHLPIHCIPQHSDGPRIYPCDCSHLGLVLESTEGLAVEQASVVPLEFGADVVVAGIQLVLPLDCLLPVGMTFSTGFLNKCVLHS